jgi:hypothetical protein
MPARSKNGERPVDAGQRGSDLVLDRGGVLSDRGAGCGQRNGSKRRDAKECDGERQKYYPESKLLGCRETCKFCLSDECNQFVTVGGWTKLANFRGRGRPRHTKKR